MPLNKRTETVDIKWESGLTMNTEYAITAQTCCNQKNN